MSVERTKGAKPKKKNNKNNKAAAATPANNLSTPASPVSVGSEATALNPPFDPRMRRIGSPLNQASRLRRGWIQSEDGTKRVNFMLNPSGLDAQHSLDISAPQPSQLDKNDPGSFVAGGSQSSTGVSLLYDRTYELFSPPASNTSLANTYGVYADIAAWYTYLGMFDRYPNNWTETIISSPIVMTQSYLFVGPQMVFYGYPSSISVSISHWTQTMIPQRCKIDIGFSIVPKGSTSFAQPIGPGFSPDAISQYAQEGWTGDLATTADNGTGIAAIDSIIAGILGGDD